MGDGEGRRGFKTTKISPAKTNRWLGNSLRVAVKGEKEVCTYYLRHIRPYMLGLDRQVYDHVRRLVAVVLE